MFVSFNDKIKEVPLFLQCGELYKQFNIENDTKNDIVPLVYFFLEDDNVNTVDEFIKLVNTLNYWIVDYKYNEEFIENNIVEIIDNIGDVDENLSILLIKYCPDDYFGKMCENIGYQINSKYLLEYIVNNVERRFLFGRFFSDMSINDEIYKKIIYAKNIRMYLDLLDCFVFLDKDCDSYEYEEYDEIAASYTDKYPVIYDERYGISYQNLIKYLMNLIVNLNMNTYINGMTLFEHFLCSLRKSNNMIFENLQSKYNSDSIQYINNTFIGDLIMQEENSCTSDLFYTFKNKKEINFEKYIPQLIQHHPTEDIEEDIFQNRAVGCFLYYLLEDDKNREIVNKIYDWDNIIPKEFDEEENTLDNFMSCIKYEVESITRYAY